MKLMITLDDEKIISIAEMLLLIHLVSVHKNLQARIETIPELYFFQGMDAQVVENLYSLLRAPLKNPTFREKFRGHFEAHAIGEFRNAGWRWLQTVLTEES